MSQDHDPVSGAMPQKVTTNCGKTCLECGVSLPTGKDRNGEPWGPLCYVCEQADEEKHRKYKALSWAIMTLLGKRLVEQAGDPPTQILDGYLDTLKQIRAEL